MILKVNIISSKPKIDNKINILQNWNIEFKEITSWVNTDINYAVKRQENDQKQDKIYPLIPFYAQSMQNGVTLPLLLGTLNAVENIIGDPDKIEYIIRQALCLDNSTTEPVYTPEQTIPTSKPSKFHKHSINYKLKLDKETAC